MLLQISQVKLLTVPVPVPVHGFSRTLLCALVAVGMLWSANAQAIYLDFADYRGSQNGNRADISIDGVSITITSQPSEFDLTISSNGLGVGCTNGFFGCLTNSRTQIDAEWNEQITITFNDGPVSLNQVILSQIYRGEVAVVGTDDYSTNVTGQALRRRNSNSIVDMSGIGVTEIVVSARGWFSDASVRAIDFNTIRPVDSVPTSPIPEPNAALLFAAGVGVVAVRRRRR